MLFDVSMPVDDRMATWPGDEPFSCGWTMTKASDSSVNVGWVKQSAHVGTHVDAPFHVDDAGPRIGGLALDAFIGPALVIDARNASRLDETLLKGPATGGQLRAAPRVLFRTRSRATDPGVFHEGFPTLTPGAVRILESMGVKLVGIDAPSVDPVDSKDLAIHHALGKAGIVNVENLLLDDIAPGKYELLAAPVRWRDMDAAPIRAILRR